MENHDLIEVEGDLVIHSEERESKRSEPISIPNSLLDTILKGIQNNPTSQELIRASEDATELFKVVLRPDLQEGIDSGKLVWDGCSVDLRNAKTNRYAGKITLQKSELPLDVNKRDPSNTALSLSNVTKAICSVSGQAQLADISKKIDVLDEKIDSIIENSWREKIAALQSATEMVNHALIELPDKNALGRINQAILEIGTQSNYFRLSIESVISKKITLSVLTSFKESMFTWFGKNKGEYNEDFIKDIRELLEEYGFLIDCYIQAETLLGSCYQVIEGYEKAKKYYNKVEKFVDYSSHELFKKLVFLLDINDDSVESPRRVENILPLIENRQLPIKEAVKIANDKGINGINKTAQIKQQLLNGPKIIFDLPREILLKEEGDDVYEC
ncbi:hypothetical protein [Halobacillus karajensis]|uniref:Uncharacterized protein n=1 Tax=Halobacillus karajensis TaxID=195088 RepID=A0A059NXW9_9BACI|nr:hypothetical protein [Halobacillus karajensis]CDQ20885.1 hypothetical protein BN982_03240 [Halobacillus karajensis]CDQ23645.1 hypothetical protein BN983_01896 [Halobacillus karajensis]CDQ27123.1 hypothetical protein BN981_01377 [Halobacillus karajensis]